METIKNIPLVKKLGFNRIILILVLILMYFVFSLGSGRLLGAGDLMNALNMVDYLGFLALGVTFVIATGGIDFSIGPVMVCAGLIAGRLLVTFGWPLWLALIMCVVVGACFGVINGIMVSYMGLPSFISSMASMMLAKGVGSVFTHVQNSNWPKTGDPNSWYKYFVSYNGFPTGLVFLLVVAIICAIILNRTKIGRYILCIGSNREAVRLSGVDTRRWEALAYIICGILAGIAAITYVGVITQVQPGLGDEFNNNAIASCVMGGTSMAGGVASMGGTLIGVFIISLLRVGIQAMGFRPDYQYIITGVIVALAVFADIRSSARKK
ncbi:MAG: ABC transporter permease [Clostridia bacterium]|nr:ABC transporter permease [Clostridia bacterium]MBR4443596.1 ABC transporter permease [Clostridia bacterium]